MLSNYISSKVLTIGCAYNPPRGGVAQVMYTYSKEVFPYFNCITNSGSAGFLSKLVYALCAILKLIYVLLFNKDIKVIHIHTASYNSFARSSYFVSIAKFFHKKVILHIHGGGFKEYYNTNPIWIKKELLKADYIIALTDSWKHYFHDELQLPKVAIVKNIISNPQLLDVKHDGRLHLLFLGFIIEKKGIFDLAEVINEHKDKWEGKLVLHVGGSHEVERLQNFVKINKLENLIQYEGWVSGEKKAYLLNMMDAYILPSYTEGLPISILESLSYGKPIITTSVGGIPEIVNDQNGFLFEPGDKEAMYHIISRIINNPIILQEKGINARASVDEYFPDKISEVLGGVYEELF